MLENLEQKQSKIEKELSFEARQNAVGFFILLLKVNRKNNPKSKNIRMNLSFQFSNYINVSFLILKNIKTKKVQMVLSKIKSLYLNTSNPKKRTPKTPPFCPLAKNAELLKKFRKKVR